MISWLWLLPVGFCILFALVALITAFFYREKRQTVSKVADPVPPDTGKGKAMTFNPALHDIVVTAEYGIDLFEKEGSGLLKTLEKGTKIAAEDLGKTAEEVLTELSGMVAIVVKPFRAVPHPAPNPGIPVPPVAPV
jgi:hypothetical protein